ncbi:hypothetical protein [Pleomorphomonas sp. NRK KF1]|nr:hypothetical protein [Pleomorphomonas sp. NRK KF1]MCM5553513.1 hypothetical protein [Pleomorphomonas sp. NRK KF1]
MSCRRGRVPGGEQKEDPNPAGLEDMVRRFGDAPFNVGILEGGLTA